MDQTHAHREKNYAAKASLITAVILTILKLTVGVYTNSLGILSEALHSAFDLLAAIITLFAIRLAAQPADTDHAYGHGKIENIAALAETLLLLITCGWIITEAVERLLHAKSMVMPSLWGVLVMGISIVLDAHRARLLRKVAKKYNSQALEADALHFSSDMLSSAVVLVGLLIIWCGQFLPEQSMWRPIINSLDAVAALIVSLVILHACYIMARKAINALMDGSSEELRLRLERTIKDIAEIRSIKKIRLRSSGAVFFVDMTICVPAHLSVESSHHITQEAEQRIQAILPQADITIHVEPFVEPFTENAP